MALFVMVGGIVVAGLSERKRTSITAALWNRRGLPVMLAAWRAFSGAICLLILLNLGWLWILRP